MDYKVCICTDVGTRKTVNQDCATVKVAGTKQHGRILLAVLCDGMGGLSQGEVASSKTVKAIENWFVTKLPMILSNQCETIKLDETMETRDYLENVEREWNILANDINQELIQYGYEQKVVLGTTVVSMIIFGSEYLIMSIGDSRCYHIESEGITQLTHDHSVVQSMIDRGVLTPEQAKTDPQKNVLLQCLGGVGNVRPQMIRGEIGAGDSFVLCCDGLWRQSQKDEIGMAGKVGQDINEDMMKENMLTLIDTVKSRGETDNITAITIGIE